MGQQGHGMAAQALEPGELIGEFFAVGGIAVGQVDGGDADHLLARLNQRLDIARLLVVRRARQPLRLDGHGVSGEDGDAVVGLLADDRQVIAEIFDLEAREAVRRAFQFLEQGDVGAKALQPADEVADALTDRIDVPGGDADQTEKELPQPQEEVALGLRTWTDAPTSSSTKSISDPASRSREAESTKSFTPSREKTESSSVRVSSKENPYWKPEHPPPDTARRNIRAELPS